MPICRARYHTTVNESNLRCADLGILDCIAEEIREPDEWGEPGELVRRVWISAIDRHGRNHASALNGGRLWPRGKLEPFGGLQWFDLNPSLL